MPVDQVQQTVQVALFGPQVTNWTQEGLFRLQSQLMESDDIAFLRNTLAQLPSLWGLVQDKIVQSDPSGEMMLNELAEFVAGDGLLDPARLRNTHLAPLTIISQVLDLAKKGGNDARLPDYQAAQGFCVGFLTAASFACSSNWDEFATCISNSIRLAACIGLVIDAEDAAQAAQDRATAMSLRWKTPADRALIETCLDSFKGVYISCVTDDCTLTVTLPTLHQAAFNYQLGKNSISATVINLHGSYHHEKQTKAAETLKKLCVHHDNLQLPSADKLHLRLPLRSTIDADVVSSGLLHDIAIDSILCKRAHWFQTVKMTVTDVLRESIKYVSLGSDSCIPRSLLRNRANSRASSVGEEENMSSSISNAQIEEIAVVGMACRFANADCLQEFWELLSSGGASVSKLPTNRFDSSSIHREPSLPDFWGNFLKKPGAFDHRFFGMSGREAKSLDPQQRLALQVAYEALESSGYCGLAPKKRETDVGCYIGVVGADYEDNVASDAANAFSATGTLRAFVSGRISHYFGWSGPSIVLDTACSSSSVAVHTACRALLNGECAMALAGGVNIMTSPNMHQNLAAGSFLNPNGASRAFDAAGSGYCRGEGAGILVLKKLSKAVSDNDMIIGVIAGTAVNQGSGCSGITVPSSQAQSLLYKKALSVGHIKLEEVTYVEAHGTGTPVGDPIEYESVRASLTSPARNETLFLGSVKDNIGHTEAASGVAGVIKTLLMLHHGIIPKQANFTTLSPRINSSPLDHIVVPKTTQPWITDNRVALVNNYGAAGSNAAIVLRGHTSRSKKPQPPWPKTKAFGSAPYPILISAKSIKSLHSYADALGKYLDSTSELDSIHLAYNVTLRQDPSFEYRLALASVDTKHFISGLKEQLAKSTYSSTQRQKSPVVLCFGGQTGRSVFLPRELYDNCDVLRKHLDECDTICHSLGLPCIVPSIFDGGDTEDIVSLHCVLLSLQISCARSWIDCGLEVDTLIGHSFGQLAAVCVAGSISLRDAFRLVSGRARLIRDSWGPERGVMLSVECSRAEMEEVVEVVNSLDGCRVDVACYNGPRSFVLTGDTPSMERLEQECRGLKTKRLNNTHGYHSYLADGILRDLRAIANSIAIQPPQIHVETCSSNHSWPDINAEELTQHTRQPVYFGEAINRIATRVPSAVWLEAGSASPIIAMTRRLLREHDRQDMFLAMDLGNADAASKLADAACQIWKSGGAAAYWPFHRSSSYRFQSLNIPPYQFEDTHHWIENKPRSTAVTVESPTQLTFKPKLLKLVAKDLSKGSYTFSVDRTHPTFDAIVRGHAVTGQCLCPATMYTELATRCANLTSESESELDKLPYIEGLVMSHPLGLSGDQAIHLRLVQTSEHSWTFTAFSQPYKNGTPESEITEHATGNLSLVSKNDAISLSRWKILNRVARVSHADRVQSLPSAYGISGPMVYRLFADVVEYAPFYRQVNSVRASENEAVGTVTISDGRPHGVDIGLTDPITLDSFIQVAGIHINCLSSRGNDEVFVCNAVEEIAVSSSFMESRTSSQSWMVYTRYEKTSKVNLMNDIFVYDAESKELVVAIMGASFRSVPYKYLTRSLSKLDTAIVRPTSSSSNNTMDSNSDDAKDSTYTSCATTPASQRFGDKRSELFDEPIPVLQRDQAPTVSKKKDDLLNSVRKTFSEVIEIPIEEIEPTSILNDLGVDSLLATEILTEMQKRFMVSISQEQFQNCIDIISLCQLIQPDDNVSTGSLVKKQKAAKSIFGNAKFDNIEVARSQKDEEETKEMVNFASISRDCFLEVKPTFDQFAEATGYVNFCSDAYKLQAELVAQYVVEAISSLGHHLRSMQAGDEVPLIEHLPRHKYLVSQLYRILEDAGLVVQDSHGRFQRSLTPVPTSSASSLYTRMLDKYPQHESETKVLHATGSKLADCLSGKADPLALLFRDSAIRASLEDVYKNAPMFKAISMLLSQYLVSAVKRFGNSREIRVLEIGAGTGGTTQHLAHALSELDVNFSYTFSDISSSLVANARRRFANWSFMRYKVVDIEGSVNPEFVGGYDIILSTNCIHATHDLVHTTTNIRKMLKPDGILCLVEATRNLYWFDLVFGLLDGWWLSTDGRDHPLVDEQRWARDLCFAGFKWIDWSAGASEESELIKVITASPFDAAPTVDTSMTLYDNLKGVNNTPSQQTLIFKTVDGLDLFADIYYPPTVDVCGRSRPVALMIHGGGHVMLSRKDVRPEQTNLLLEKGFLPISVDYRLCPETTLHKGPMTDVRDALAWVRATLPKLHLSRPDVQVNGNKVVAVGWSTGGHLAMSLAWSGASIGIRAPDAILAFYCPIDYEDAFWMEPNIPADSKTKNTVNNQSSYELDESIWGAVSDRAITAYNVPTAKRALGGWMAPSDPRSRLVLHMNWHGQTLHVLLNGLNKQTREKPDVPSKEDIISVSPLAQARIGTYTTPTFIIHPREDDLIPWQQAERLWQSLRIRGTDSELRIVEHVPHLFDLYRKHRENETVKHVIQEGYEFLCKYVGLC